MEELIKLVEKIGWEATYYGDDEGDTVNAYPYGKGDGVVFYTIYEYPDTFTVMRSRLTGDDISDVVLGDWKTEKDVIKAIKADTRKK